MIWGIRRDQMLDNWFGKAERMVQRVLDQVPTGYTADDVLLRLQLGKMQLWVVDDWKAVAVTEIAKFPQFKALMVVHLSGAGMDEWFGELMDRLEAYAAENGCRYVEAHGRRGWERKGRGLGYKHAYSIMRKDLDEVADERWQGSVGDADERAMGGATAVSAAGLGDRA